GLITIACFISPPKENREMVRVALGADFIEIFVDCPLEECEKRDPKNLYKKARLGVIKEFTGITSPYEKPEKPEIVINTKEQTLDQCVDKILDYLRCIG
ncbi:MAG TPA: adenylyl-sulfate kinase, partial [Clostridium sp.]